MGRNAMVRTIRPCTFLDKWHDFVIYAGIITKQMARIVTDTDSASLVAFNTAAGPVQLIRLLGKGKSGFSWLAAFEGRQVVCKIMHNEECGYYSFSEAKTVLEERDYGILLKIGIPVPRLLAIDHERGLLIKEFVEGQTGEELLAAGPPPSDLLTQLTSFARRCRKAGYNIDYYPTNFVITDTGLLYIDYEVNPYDDRWSLETWGMQYWTGEERKT